MIGYIFFRSFLLISLFQLCLTCTLCPLRVPPRPRPLNQYKLPSLMEFSTENQRKFCGLAKSLPVDPQCGVSFERIFCSIDSIMEKCPGNENPLECSSCSYKKQRSSWIYNWIDSLGKPGAGISDGNYYWLGDYETCQTLRKSGDFDGKYCRITLEVPDSLVEENCPQTDPLAINIGVCFPTSCSLETLENITRSISPYSTQVDCEFEVNWSSAAADMTTVSGIWVAIIVIISILTACNYEFFPRIQQACSLQQNVKKALSTKRNHMEHLYPLHGVEFLVFMCIMTGNVYNYVMPYIENVAFSFDGVHSPSMLLVNNYSYQIDGLFALSALYTTFLLYGRLKGVKDVLQVFFRQLLRVWPAYVYCILFMMFVFVRISSGPMWIHSDTVERCQNNWWKNILAINNFDDVRSTCMDFGSGMSLEAQFYVILLVMIYLAQSHFASVLVFSVVALLTCWVSSFVYIYYNVIPPVPILTAEPIAEDKIRSVLRVMQSPIYRAPAFLIAFIFGVLMKSTSQEEQSNKIQIFWRKYSPGLLVVWNLISVVFVLFALFPYASRNVGHPVFLAFYSSCHRSLWVICLLSFLYLGERGYFSWLTAILSWRVFSPLSKLTWIALVVAEPVILYFFTSLNRPSYATHWNMIYSAISAATMSYLIAFLIDIFLTRPIKSLLTNRTIDPYRECQRNERLQHQERCD